MNESSARKIARGPSKASEADTDSAIPANDVPGAAGRVMRSVDGRGGGGRMRR